MKICNKCKTEKELVYFSKHKTCKDGYENVCKECKTNISKIYYQKNIDNKKQYYLDNKDKYAERDKKYSNTKRQYHIKHKDKIKKYTLKWREENKNILCEKQKIYNKKRQHIRNSKDIERRKNDPQFRVLCSIRGRIGMLLKQNKNNKTIELLGCSFEIFKSHLEKQFKPEMTWENYGKIWEIDHIIPCSKFDLNQLEEQLKAFHYTNTQPLFKTTKIAESFGYFNETGNRNKSNHEK